MAKLANAERGQGFTHVTRIDLDAYNTTSGADDQTVTLYVGSDAKLRAASIVCPNNLTSGANTISATLGDSGDADKFITSTTISGLGASAGTAASMKAYATAAASASAYNRALSNPGFAIDTNFDIKAANAFDISVAGIITTIAADTSWDTGTTATMVDGEWIGALLSIDADGTTYVQYTNSVLSEETAVSQVLAITATGEAVVGYVAITTASGQDWTAGTDALQGGTGGNPSDDTNYYNYCALDAQLLSEITQNKADANIAANGYDITTSVVLTLSLNTGNWSENNGGAFYVLLDIADSNDLV